MMEQCCAQNLSCSKVITKSHAMHPTWQNGIVRKRAFFCMHKSNLQQRNTLLGTQQLAITCHAMGCQLPQSPLALQIFWAVLLQKPVEQYHLLLLGVQLLLLLTLQLPLLLLLTLQLPLLLLLTLQLPLLLLLALLL